MTLYNSPTDIVPSSEPIFYSRCSIIKYMSWAEKRIQQYKDGRPATFVEKRILEHANPVHLCLALIGVAAVIYGLWMHLAAWILVGVALNLLGHIYSWMQK